MPTAQSGLTGFHGLEIGAETVYLAPISMTIRQRKAMLCDQDDIFHVHQKLHDRFALSGGIPNGLLSFGTPDEVREFCLRVIREVAHDGGYIMDAGA
jgi:hypothetical protein